MGSPLVQAQAVRNFGSWPASASVETDRDENSKVFQDDVRERKEGGKKDIVDLHRSLIQNFFATVCSSSFFLGQMRD